MTDADQLDELTRKWCADLGGKDSRVGIGAALNVIATIGNYCPPDERSATAMFLRRIAEELEATRAH